jgi:hypothetical protein
VRSLCIFLIGKYCRGGNVNDEIEPADAARALSEIDRRREQVIRRRVIPAWNWWAHAVLTVALAASIESGSGVVVWTGIAMFAVGSIVINVPVSRAARAAAPRRGLAGPGSAQKTLIGLVTFAAGVIGVGVATGLSLKAAGVPHPGTIAAAIAAAVIAVGGPMLVRYEAGVLVRRSRGQG